MDNGFFIGEICRRAGCTPRTVRHYEGEGLVFPVAMTLGKQKLYGKASVSIIQTAQLLQRLGYSLKDIRHVLTLTKSDDTVGQRLTVRLREMLAEAISRIDSEVALLTESRSKIFGLLQKTAACRKCASEDCNECGKLEELRTLGILESK